MEKLKGPIMSTLPMSCADLNKFLNFTELQIAFPSENGNNVLLLEQQLPRNRGG